MSMSDELCMVKKVSLGVEKLEGDWENAQFDRGGGESDWRNKG